uniref:Low-density lipoprotein receptor-related protein 1-like isoform X1 n=1 Tax=Crassostrea virginica TaxID=6565 RepID=A0A8B8DJY6_CRAVI|nr:low-density lipoprotein receptor-related protein 1-like isoform X1 [Crassostrea virginica]
MTVQQFSLLDSQDIPQTQPATRRFLVISVICFVIAFICICTVAGVVFSNTGEGSQPRVDTSYGDLNSKTSLRSSSSFEIQPSTSLATPLTADTKSTPILFSTTAPSTLQSMTDSELSGKSSLVATMYPSATMIPVTSSLLQMLSSFVSSSSEISLISRSSPIFQTSVRDFSSDVLSSFHSSILSTGLPNTTIGPLITLPVCPDSKFTCRSGECINLSARCNRYQDCQDKSDEENCLNCVGVQCDSGLCLWSWSPLCDGMVDCPDLSDEVNCASDSKIQCENGVWIYKNQWCNGIDNCYDNSDERNCSCLAGLETECGDGRCIRSDWVCDGYQDCSTDETGCGSGCDRNQYVCEDYSCITNPLCVMDAWTAPGARKSHNARSSGNVTSGMYDARQYLELSDNQTDNRQSSPNTKKVTC